MRLMRVGRVFRAGVGVHGDVDGRGRTGPADGGALGRINRAQRRGASQQQVSQDGPPPKNGKPANPLLIFGDFADYRFASCVVANLEMVEAEGLEPTTHSNRIKGGMWVCTRERPHNSLPPELLDAVRTWGRLPESLRTAVLAILRMGAMPVSAGEGGQPVRRNSTSTGGADGLPIGKKNHPRRMVLPPTGAAAG